MDVGDRRELYSGFGNSLTWAVEFAATPALFGLIGHFLDSRLGTSPLLTVALVIFAVAGLVVRAYYGYMAAMERHEAHAPWASSPRKQPRPEGQPPDAGVDLVSPAGAGGVGLAEQARLPGR